MEILIEIPMVNETYTISKYYVHYITLPRVKFSEL